VMGKRLERGGTSGLNSTTLGAATREGRESMHGARGLCGGRWSAVPTRHPHGTRRVENRWDVVNSAIF
jgi:hypothetical protein